MVCDPQRVLGTHKGGSVLILVVVEDGLRPAEQLLLTATDPVLILVVVEDGLRQPRSGGQK